MEEPNLGEISPPLLTTVLTNTNIVVSRLYSLLKSPTVHRTSFRTATTYTTNVITTDHMDGKFTLNETRLYSL